MKFLLGTKKEMTQIFSENGEFIPVTVIKAGPCVITQKKIIDGYKSIQVGFGEKKKITKALKGLFSKNDNIWNCRYLKECKTKDQSFECLEVGNILGAEIFEPGDVIAVSGESKGKGFQGVVKRHGFHGSPASHGHKDQLRMPGSIGATEPAHVFKGTRMAGRMGGGNITIKNLKVIKADKDKNLLYIKGAIPGAYNGLVKIKGEGEMNARE